MKSKIKSPVLASEPSFKKTIMYTLIVPKCWFVCPEQIFQNWSTETYLTRYLRLFNDVKETNNA